MIINMDFDIGVFKHLDDLDGVAEPVTELGKLHHAWVRERGLPLGLDHHDHS